MVVRVSTCNILGILVIMVARGACLNTVENVTDNLLVIHYLLTENRCGSDFRVFNFADSLLYAIDYISATFKPRIPYTPYFTFLNGCSLMEEDRAGKLMKTMHLMSAITLEIAGFSALLGPPLTVDCDLVNDWISLGVAETSAVDRLYQISYACRSQSQETVFAKQEAVEVRGQVPTLRRLDSNNFAAISLVLTTSTLVTGLSTLLSFYGWQKMAIFHEVSLEGGESAFLAQQIVLTLSVGGASTGPFSVVRRQGLRPGMDHSALLEDNLFLVHCLHAQLKLNLFLTEDSCGPYFETFNYPFSITSPLKAMTSLEGWHRSGKPPEVKLLVVYFKIPGCSLRRKGRTSAVLDALRIMNETTAIGHEFSVFVGPPMTGDCGLVADWISLDDQGDLNYFGLYQISFVCRKNIRAEALDRDDQNPNRNYINMFSTAVKTKTYLKALNALLYRYRCKYILLYYELSPDITDNELFANELSVLLANNEYELFQVIEVSRLLPGITRFSLIRLENQTYDAIILLTRPALAKEFLLETRNVTAIQQGKIAIIHIEPTDMLTYDVLQLWRNELESGVDLGAAGQCLILMTTLPTRTVYQPNSSIYEQKINLAAAAAAGLAMRLTQLNVKLGGGKLDPTKGLFAPMNSQDVYVPITPEITFQFEHYGTNEIRGLYDMFIFSLNPDASSARRNVSTMTFEEIFLLTDVILWPLIAVQNIGTKVWPGGSSGPNRNPCLIYDCEMASSVQEITLIFLGGIIIIGVANLIRVLYIRRLQQKKKVLGGNAKLILYTDDISFINEGKQVSGVSVSVESRVQ
ncbi:unnamed protein product [Schistocephalus solidus]|uniref:Guanylate cyclase n=1 Tax=Schistocephalus solidus TaxID=70667 RepID=A0A183S894_SCHSO|nr:unnamed protein product [Schistocephalus solidus]